ncbi:hypothetical protein DICPUDRAFT_158106 [Dictyostelium purpureum]|uniref:Histidine kinase n=1 Tax=Dictyostelium purpureum TaxID=5786 RepID=F1A0V0_DICPU|nr:uncharacterized protein DICPUDRAFT_158106 [Dictyostelium purpureum]EGC30187.1 hypothetical protein DICPUDRAFT_158106 [Dictyostelium purpureum]|eukprot:XP_003293294.1 hypothetical protein DICPUDRAFT_158106 [Dictyostelium purpureum]
MVLPMMQFFNIDNLIFSVVILSPFLILSYIFLNKSLKKNINIFSNSNNNNSNNNSTDFNNIVEPTDISNNSDNINNNEDFVDGEEVADYSNEDQIEEEEYFEDYEQNSFDNLNYLFSEIEEKINHCIQESNLLNSYGINDSVNSYFSEEELYYSNLNGNLINSSNKIVEINDEMDQSEEEPVGQEFSIERIKQLKEFFKIDDDSDNNSNSSNNNNQDLKNNIEVINEKSEINKMKKDFMESEEESGYGCETSSIMESDDESCSMMEEDLNAFKNIKIFSGSIIIIDKELTIISVSDSIKSIFSNYNEINGMNSVQSNSNSKFNFLSLIFNDDKKHLEQFLKSKFSKNVNDSNFNINTIFFKGLNYINNIDPSIPFEMQMTVLPFVSNSYLVLSLKDLSPQPLKLVLNAFSPRSLSSSNNNLSPRSSAVNNALSPRNNGNNPLSPRNNSSNGNSALSPRNNNNNGNSALSPRSSSTNGSNPLSPRSNANNTLSPRSSSNSALSPRSSSANSSSPLSPRSSSSNGSSSSRPSTPRPGSVENSTLSPRSSSSQYTTCNAPYSPKASPRKMPNHFSFDSMLNNKSIDMISHLSHELRTPIHSVIASIQLFRSTILTVTQNEYLSIIDTSANTLLELVSNVLDYKRIRSGKLTLNNVDFNLCHIIEDVCAMVSPQAQSKSLQIASFVFIHCPLSFYGDPIRLRQVLCNGIKYTNKGQVCISVEPTVTENKSNNNGESEGDQNIMSLHFKVKDSGIGIKEEHISKLFSGFSQVNNGGTIQEALGSGLGLAISKDLVELMGGKIWCSSNAAQGEAGCTFHFVIPLETNPKQLPCPVQNFNGLSVLVVDKNPFVQKVLCQYLEGWSCEVTTCSDLKEAYSQLKIDFKRKPIEVVMIDIDSIEFRDFIQFKEAFNRFEFGRIGLISMSSDRSMVNEMGFGTSKLTKPFRQSHLIACLLASMPEHSMPSSTTCFTNNTNIINNTLGDNSSATPLLPTPSSTPNTTTHHHHQINSTPHVINKESNFRRLSLSLNRIGNGSSANSNTTSLIYDSPSPRLKNPKLIELEQQETNPISPPLRSSRQQSSLSSPSSLPSQISETLTSSPVISTTPATGSLPPISASSSQSQQQQLQQQLQQVQQQQQQQQSFNYGRVTRRHSIDIIMFENSRELSELRMKEVLEERNAATPRSYSFSGPSTNNTQNGSYPTIGEVDSQIGGASNSSLAQSPNSLSPRLPTKIMVIDDNVIGLKLFNKLFENRSEFECHCYNSSEKALAVLDQINPQFIFMDCEMPVINGFECTKIIRKKEMEASKGRNKIVIIALTAHNDPEIFKKCLDSGMDDYISKGFKQGTIDSMLRKWEDIINSTNSYFN